MTKFTIDFVNFVFDVAVRRANLPRAQGNPQKHRGDCIAHEYCRALAPALAHQNAGGEEEPQERIAQPKQAQCQIPGRKIVHEKLFESHSVFAFVTDPVRILVCPLMIPQAHGAENKGGCLVPTESLFGERRQPIQHNIPLQARLAARARAASADESASRKRGVISLPDFCKGSMPCCRLAICCFAR